MAWTTAVAIYFLIWWITLFAVLPFGVRSQHEGEAFEQGTDPGAPIAARIWAKLMWTTIVTSVIFAALAAVYHYRLVTMDDLFRLFGADRLMR